MLSIALSHTDFATVKSGGARASLLTFLDGISENREINVDAYQTPPVDDPPDAAFDYQIHTKQLRKVPKLTWTNQVINRVQWRRYLRGAIKPDHDLLITQNKLAPASVTVANEFDIPSIYRVSSWALTGYEKYSPELGHLANLRQTDLGGRIQYPFLWKNFHEYRHAARNATRTVANSEFTARKMKELFGTEAATIVNPPIEVEDYKVPYNSDGYITMVNPRTEYKGADIFLDIADQLSDENFLLVGPIGSTRIRERSKQLSNVTHWEWCDDMREAYAEAKVVIVPSRVEESFGRVPAEAMVSGIPCVVSNRGALPEVVGEAGEIIEDVESINAWINGIERALESRHPEEQQRQAERFSAETQVDRLVSLIDEINDK